MSLSLQLGECVGFVLPNARVYPSTEINIDVGWLDNIVVGKGEWARLHHVDLFW